MKIEMYADGASKRNPGNGGWGVLLLCPEKNMRKEICGYGGDSVTNNQMEILAALKGLEALKLNCDVTLYTDSNYVVQGINEWLSNWKANNWIGKTKKPIANKELWEKLDAQLKLHNVTAVYVKGHSGVQGNEIADALANKGIEEYLAGKTTA